MIVTTTYRVAFDPVKEYEHAQKFASEHNDWKADLTTVSQTFTKTETYLIELKDEAEA